MRVLLVEDHPPLAEAVSDALRRAGFAVDHAATAQAARELAGLADHALVLLDLGLPDGDGLRLLPVLRQGGRVPVIVLTARDQLADRLAGWTGVRTTTS
jgi:DNA-binding response OmpR family regulator